MKKTQMLIPMLAILMLALAITPALAAKEETKIKYTLTGIINDMDKGISGSMLLTVSGNLRLGTPGYKYAYYGVDSGVDISRDYREEYWWDWEGKQWKAEVLLFKEASWTESYSVYEARWYSPQPTWSGEIVATWGPSSATTFKVNLSPFMITKMVREGTSEGETSYTEMRHIYYWDDEIKEWVWNSDETYSWSYTWSYTYSNSMFGIAFSGKIQSKGRPPFEGMLSLSETTSITNGDIFHLIVGGGLFGPYLLTLMI